METDGGKKQDMKEIGHIYIYIYIDQFAVRLLSYRYLALSSNAPVSISIGQQSPREKGSSSFMVGQHKRLIRC